MTEPISSRQQVLRADNPGYSKGLPYHPRALAQRIVRAKAKIRDTPIWYEVPTPQKLPERPGTCFRSAIIVVVVMALRDQQEKLQPWSGWYPLEPKRHRIPRGLP